MTETKRTLVQLPSGSVDVVERVDGHVTMLMTQFNCSCNDAQPYCRSMCCRMQNMYSAELNEEEAARLGARVIERVGHPDLIVIQTKMSNASECMHFDNYALRCGVQATKPQQCKDWHCSPGGVGEGITRRANGWVMLPTQQ